MKARPSTRRAFIQSGLAGVLAAGLAPRVISSHLLGADAPSKKITLGCIGVGKHGLGVNLKSFLAGLSPFATPSEAAASARSKW